MGYLDYLELHKEEFVRGLDVLIAKYEVQPVGSGYIDCIILQDSLEFIREVGILGVLVESVSWWCRVDPDESRRTGCPHGMGGPISQHYGGWFSELDYDFPVLDRRTLDTVLARYDAKRIYSLDVETIAQVLLTIERPFRYSLEDYMKDNRCLCPAPNLLVPDKWTRP